MKQVSDWDFYLISMCSEIQLSMNCVAACFLWKIPSLFCNGKWGLRNKRARKLMSFCLAFWCSLFACSAEASLCYLDHVEGCCCTSAKISFPRLRTDQVLILFPLSSDNNALPSLFSLLNTAMLVLAQLSLQLHDCHCFAGGDTMRTN